LQRSAEQTKPATQHTHRWVPPHRFAGFGAKAPLSTSQRATANRYGITLDPTWTEWAAKQGVPETIAAALYLISENRKTDEGVNAGAEIQLAACSALDVDISKPHEGNARRMAS
jgi:hypothetical protein